MHPFSSTRLSDTLDFADSNLKFGCDSKNFLTISKFSSGSIEQVL